MPARHLILGAEGEEAACRHLVQAGYAIRHRNWRHGGLELDIVCERDPYLVFVEVKTRGPGSLGGAAQAVDGRKQGKLVKAAAFYLSKHRLWDRPCRFDVVAVIPGPQGPVIEHVEDAFDAHALRGGHASWQPW